MITGVRATGRKSMRLSMAGWFFGTGMIVDDLRQDGTTACDRERLKIEREDL